MAFEIDLATKHFDTKNMQILLTFLLTAVPTLLLGLFFYSKNPRTQPFGEIAKIFLLGILSVLPVILFNFYALEHVTSWLSQLLGIDGSMILTGLINLASITLFIVLFVVLFTGIQSTFLWLFYRLPWLENARIISKKSYHLTPLLVVFLILFLVEVFVELQWKTDFLLSLVGSTVIFAVLEEYFKYLISPFLVYKKLNSIGSAMVNTIYVGLAFAFVENILFFLNAQSGPDFLRIFIFRSAFTTLLHVCASGILGYFYGSAIFSKAILTSYEIEKAEYDRFSWLTQWMGVRKKSIFRSLSVTQGFFIAATVHVVFNLLIYLGQIKFAALFTLGLCALIVYLLNLRGTQTQYGMIGTAAMPKEDFEKLRLQISVMQYAKEIEKEHSAQVKK
jgi:RsiW-degrading membrane proteinase PrsW (M82 family)